MTSGLYARLFENLFKLRLSSDADKPPILEELSTLQVVLAQRPVPEVLAMQERLKLSQGELLVVCLLHSLAQNFELAKLALAACGGREMTVDTIRDLIHGTDSIASHRELGETGTLRRLQLIERSDSYGHVHESRMTWTTARRVGSWLAGDTELDASLTSLVREAQMPGHALTFSQELVDSIEGAARTQGTIVIVSGPRGAGRRSLIVAAAKTALLEVDAKQFSSEQVSFRSQLRAIARECRLLEKAPLLRNIDELAAHQLASIGRDLVAELDTNVFVTCGPQRPQLRWERPVVVFEVKPPTSAQRAKLWQELVREASEDDAEHLATKWPLAPALMYHAADAVRARAAGRDVTPDDFTHGIRAVLDDRLGAFAKRVEVTQTWDDLVIDSTQAQSITELIARIRQRRTVYERWGFAAKIGKGLGIAALFSGPPGTGKTMVAALVAKELGLELYQVDMAKITSKFIGETEKQLAEMFDAAEAGNAILLFDEADSLFGKRTDVRSSNDRYANLETNYLLQRMESFTGICLLTSNHESNIDPAFQRRLSLHLRFQVPDPDERAMLWRAILPADAPIDPSIDFASLGRRFEMTGGYVRNAALRAAFLAADEGTAICQTHLEHAARIEYEGMGRITAPPASTEPWPPPLSSSL